MPAGVNRRQPLSRRRRAKQHLFKWRWTQQYWSFGVLYTIINSDFSHNYATHNGANPALSGTPGGVSGAAITTMTITSISSSVARQYMTTQLMRVVRRYFLLATTEEVL
jgi:hypothetical protein